MSNLSAARQAIQAELDHAREGAAYYQSRVAALEEALAKLDSVESAEEDTGNAPSAQTRSRSRRGRPAREQVAKKESELPATGKSFWTGLLTSEPQSNRELLASAIKALGIEPSGDKVKKLSQRQTNALHNLVKANEISTTGSGRGRRYYRQA